MKYIGHVSAEGGPLLMIGAKTAVHWRGTEGSAPTDYDRGCDLFENEPSPEGTFVRVGAGSALLWEMNGAGTAHVFKKDSTFIIVRAWLNEDVIDSEKDHDALLALAEADGGDAVDLGTLDLDKDILLLIWATENASAITSFGDAGSIPVGDFSIEGSALVLGKASDNCQCLHDYAEIGVGDARRLIVRGKTG